MNKMTTKQNDVLMYIKLKIKSAGYQPTIREMAEYFKITGSAIQARLNALEKKGYIIRHYKSRAIEILK